jgi:uncharacterized lipoprotein YehR (DUF1307 family)
MGRKLISLLLAMILVVSLAACASGRNNEGTGRTNSKVN